MNVHSPDRAVYVVSTERRIKECDVMLSGVGPSYASSPFTAFPCTSVSR